MKPPERYREQITAYLDEGKGPGRLLQALLELRGIPALLLANKEELEDLHDMLHYMFLVMPTASFGSVDAVQRWRTARIQERAQKGRTR